MLNFTLTPNVLWEICSKQLHKKNGELKVSKEEISPKNPENKFVNH